MTLTPHAPSTIRPRVPLLDNTRPDDDNARGETDRRYEEPLRDHRRTLLIADDDPVVLYRLKTQLSDSFRIVGLVASATEAIALAQEHQPDVALVDVEMPGGGGRVAVPGIVGCSPKTRIVMLSADEVHHVVLELLSAGAVAYVRKGVAADQLAETLAQALRVDR